MFLSLYCYNKPKIKNKIIYPVLYIPHLKALVCGFIAIGGQALGCISILGHATLKKAVLLHKTANGSHTFSGLY